MKIKADYANAPQWKETTIKSSLPKELKCLDEIAHNMWWQTEFTVISCITNLGYSLSVLKSPSSPR